MVVMGFMEFSIYGHFELKTAQKRMENRNVLFRQKYISLQFNPLNTQRDHQIAYLMPNMASKRFFRWVSKMLPMRLEKKYLSLLSDLVRNHGTSQRNACWFGGNPALMQSKVWTKIFLKIIGQLLGKCPFGPIFPKMGTP